MHVNLQVNLDFQVKVQLNLFLHMKVQLKVHQKVHKGLDPSCALPIGTRCSNELAAAPYRLAHAVPMVGLWPTTEANQIFYWDYN